MRKKLAVIFAVLFAVVVLTSSVAVGYWVLAVPGASLCSDFADCGKEEYCAPLTHYEKSYVNAKGERVLIEEVVSGVKLHKFFGLIKGKVFPVQKTINGFTVVKLWNDYGVCRNKRDKFIDDKCFEVKKPPHVNEGVFDIGFYAILNCM